MLFPNFKEIQVHEKTDEENDDKPMGITSFEREVK